MTDAAPASRPGRIRLSRTPEVATVWIGDGRSRNALRTGDWLALADAAAGLNHGPPVKTVLLRGQGATFTSGSDLTEWNGASPEEVDRSFAAMEQAFTAVEAIDVPTVAVVEGAAAGAGCQLALACDLRVAAASARIGMPILRWGILPSRMFVERLSRLAGPSRARELIYLGTMLTAARAEHYGLVSMVVTDEDLEASLTALVAGLTAQPRSGLVATKRADGRGAGDDEPARWSYFDAAEFPGRVAAFRAAPPGGGDHGPTRCA
jgi:enoyl-CoA hydratase